MALNMSNLGVFVGCGGVTDVNSQLPNFSLSEL